MHRVFSLNLVVSFLIAALFTALFVLLGLFDLTGFLTKDPAVRPLFNRYLLGQAISILPLMLGNSLAAFLLLENKGSRTLTATLVFIVVNLLLNYLFVQRMRLEAFGLALAFSLGMWVFSACRRHTSSPGVPSSASADAGSSGKRAERSSASVCPERPAMCIRPYAV